MDSDDDEFLVEALELGTADKAVPSRDDGAYGNGAVGGDGDDDDDVGKDDDDTLILSSDEEEMRRQRTRNFNVGSDDDEQEDDDSSTAVPVALPPLLPHSSSSSSSSSSENDDDHADDDDDDDDDAYDDFADYYCYGFSDENDGDIVQKPSVDTCEPRYILQMAAISARLFTGQPAATCSSVPFQGGFGEQNVGHCVEQDLDGLNNPLGRVSPDPFSDGFDDDMIRHCFEQEAAVGTNVDP